MVALLELFAAKTGAAMWRLKRQVFGVIFIAVALCLFYFQFVADGTISTVREPSSLRRDLNNLGHPDSHDDLQKKHLDSTLHDRVKFVANNKDELEQQQKMLHNRNEQEKTQMEDDVNDRTQNRGVISGYGSLHNAELQSAGQRQEDIQKAMDEMSDNMRPPMPQAAIQQFSSQPDVVMMHMDESFGIPRLGNYKYNPYGEPVYGKTDRPNYIPKQRVVHFDLKGAPPLMGILQTIIPWLATHGATAIILEYEDTFPFHGSLAQIATLNHYTPTQIQELLQLCEKHKIEVIPLVQTLGHLEFTLKLQKFSHLREVPDLPQALCPSRNESLIFIYELIDQVMRLHPNSRYVHIGCDEVFHMGECELCRQQARENLFLQHVATIAKYVRAKYGSIVLIWDDMLRHISDAAMTDYHLGELVEPMVWVYAEDIYRFVQPSMWTKYSQVFSHIWAASAFKGAFGEQLTVPNVRRHLDNHMNWLDVMSTESSKFSGGFRGLVLTGWQRYDHFAVLCELFPAALPSLAVNLISVTRGFFNSTLQTEIYDALGCAQASKYQSWINLDADPFLWDKFTWCMFPGKQAFTLMSRLDSTRRDVDSYVERVTRSRAWITDYNRRHNFSSPMRVVEDLEELPDRIHAVTSLIKSAREALIDWFDEWTIGEWIEQQIWPMLSTLETLRKESESMKRVKYWPVRPLPLLPQLAKYGISEPTSNGNTINSNNIGKSRSRSVIPT
uniref:beta-N-acetylhexosaminidase n=1 Tax=Hirondellea gigas TaxID=1518452 RepID=A0A2P2I1L9_9CRUS